MKTKTQIKKLAALLFSLVMIFTILSVGMLTAYAADDITVTIDTAVSVTLKDTDSDDYYEIGTADELYAFAAAVKGDNTINGELTANIVVNENVLTEDGKLNGEGSNFRAWTPIGYASSTNYYGTFDGGNHYISGLYFIEYASIEGLFYTNSGTVRNVGIIDSFFYTNIDVGGITGINYGTIENCYNSGSINARLHNESKVGGIVGNNYGKVENCYNTGIITAANKVGGVVGINQEGASVKNCYNTGTVNGVVVVGGVVGHNDGTVTDCYNTGSVNAALNDHFEWSGQTGGVVGINYGTTVSHCYNTGSISATGYGNYNVGGVVGTNYGSTVSNCYNTGSVSGEEFVGGVVGNAGLGSNIENCYNIGTVSGTYEPSGVAYNDSSLTNCYYLDTCGAKGAGTSATESQFTSGEIAYMLGSEWGQSIGTDKYPVLGGNEVLFADGAYYNEISEFAIKSNGTDGNKATATVAIPTAGTYTLIFADYEETRLNNVDTVTFTVDKVGTITIPSEIDITLDKDDKIMLWQDMINLVPLCEAYIVESTK